jgi:hypothetical protein
MKLNMGQWPSIPFVIGVWYGSITASKRRRAVIRGMKGFLIVIADCGFISLWYFDILGS